MSTCIWDTSASVEDSLVARYEHHTEFVLGCDFNLMIDGRFADCSWDETVSVYDLSKQFNAKSNAAAASKPPPSINAAAASAAAAILAPPQPNGGAAPSVTGTGGGGTGFTGALNAFANSLASGAAASASGGAAPSVQPTPPGGLAPPPLVSKKA